MNDSEAALVGARLHCFLMSGVAYARLRLRASPATPRRSRSPLVGSGTDCAVHIEPPYVPDSHVKVAVDVLFGFAPRSRTKFFLLA